MCGLCCGLGIRSEKDLARRTTLPVPTSKRKEEGGTETQCTRPSRVWSVLWIGHKVLEGSCKTDNASRSYVKKKRRGRNWSLKAMREHATGKHHGHVRESFHGSLESIAAGLMGSGDVAKQSSLFLLQLIREGGAHVATQACLCSKLINAVKMMLATQSDLQQPEDASLLLLELSVFPTAAAVLYSSKIHLVASSLAWEHSSTSSVSWTAKTLSALAAANIDRRPVHMTRTPQPHLFAHMSALFESCIESYWRSLSTHLDTEQPERTDGPGKQQVRGTSITSALPSLMASITSLMRSTQSAHLLLHTSIPSCLFALVKEHDETCTPLAASILISQTRDWVDDPAWQECGLPAPIFEEECSSVLELAVAMLVILADTPPLTCLETDGRDGCSLLSSDLEGYTIIAPLAFGKVRVAPRVQRLCLRLLHRLRGGLGEAGGGPETGASGGGEEGGYGGQGTRGGAEGGVNVDEFLKWVQLNSSSKDESLARSLVPALALSPLALSLDLPALPRSLNPSPHAEGKGRGGTQAFARKGRWGGYGYGSFVDNATSSGIASAALCQVGHLFSQSAMNRE